MSDNFENIDSGEMPEFIEMTDVLDLHGTDHKIIKPLVRDFLDNAIELRLHKVRIIHGKGKSVLKTIVYSILEKHPGVIEYYDAPPHLGHWGATIVKLKIFL